LCGALEGKRDVDDLFVSLGRGWKRRRRRGRWRRRKRRRKGSSGRNCERKRGEGAWYVK
jgi:hypothetical protein